MSRWRKAQGYDLYDGWPPSAEQQVRARANIDGLEQEYRAGNIASAWLAVLEARNAGLPLPEWVLDYLYDAAGNIHQLAFGEKQIEGPDGAKYQLPEKGAALVQALGFGRGGIREGQRAIQTPWRPAPWKKPGPFNALELFREKQEELEIAFAVWRELSALAAEGITRKDNRAYEGVADAMGLSASKVRDVWKKHEAMNTFPIDPNLWKLLKKSHTS